MASISRLYEKNAQILRNKLENRLEVYGWRVYLDKLTFLTFLVSVFLPFSSFSKSFSLSISLSDVCFIRSTSISSSCRLLKNKIPKISVRPEKRNSQKLNFIIELTRCGFNSADSFSCCTTSERGLLPSLDSNVSY